jgi:capsular polysaccharide biosynthesis protein
MREKQTPPGSRPGRAWDGPSGPESGAPERPAWPQFGFAGEPARSEPKPRQPPPRATSQATKPPASARAEPDNPPPVREPRQRPRTAGPLEAFLRHPFLTILPILLGVAIALAVGLQRDPVYTSKARITVGRVDVPAYTLQDVVIGNQALASSYARVISTAPVVRSTSQSTGLSQGQVRSKLSATFIPQSTLIQVEAEGGDSREAVTLANAGARSLITYVQRVNSSTKGGDLLARFSRARSEAARLQRRVTALERSRAPQRQIERARVEVAAARLRASNLANVYRGSNSDPASGSPLKLIAPAASASSDRNSMLQRLLLIGLAAGLVVGLGLALLRANRGRLRAMRA